MKLFKRLFLVVGALVLLAAGAAAYLVSTFDGARVKGEIESIVFQKTGRKLHIDEKIGLNFYPDLAVALGGLHLSERGQPDREFAAVEHARVSVKLMPLLAKRVEARLIELVGLKARIVVDQDGKRNIDDLFAPPAPAAAPGERSTTAQGEPLPSFSIAGIRIRGASLTYSDERHKQSYTLSDFELSTGVLANAAGGDFKTAGKLDAAGVKVGFDAGGVYRYDLGQDSYAAEQLVVGLRGDAAGVKGMDLVMRIAGIGFKGERNVVVDKLALTAKGQYAADSFDANLEVPMLQLTSRGASGEAFKLDARLSGKDGPLAVALLAADVRGAGDSVQVGALSMKVDGKRGGSTLNVDLKTSVNANLATHTVHIAKLAGVIDLANPAAAVKSIRLNLEGNVRADWAKPGANGDMLVKFDETTIRTKWNLARVSPLTATFDLAIDRLNVDRYLPPAPKSAGGANPAAARAVSAAEAPIDLKALAGPEISGEIRIGELQASNLKLSDVRGGLQLRAGKLDLTTLSASVYGGRMSGEASLDSRGNRIAVKQKLEGISINPLLKDLAAKDALEGRGNVALDINTSGSNVAAMKRALAGNAAVSLRDGAIKGINLAKTFREFKARIGSRQDALHKAAQSDKTDFSEMIMSFKIAAGVAHSDDLSVKSPFLRLAGAGDIDVGESTVNYLAKASVVNTSGGQEGKGLDHLKGMTIPVRLSGPFDNLAYKIEFGALVQDAVKAQVQEKIQQKVESKLGDQLRGLLRK